MSRPNHALAFGLSRAFFRMASAGSVWVNSCGTAAITTKIRMSTTETQKIGFFFSWRQASEARERAPPSVAWVVPVSAPTAMVVASVMADPRVEHAVQKVDD